MSNLRLFREIVDKIRREVLKNRVIKPIDPEKYEIQLNYELLPIMHDVIDVAKDNILRLRESAADDAVDGLINGNTKELIASRIYLISKDAAIASAINTATQYAFPYSIKDINDKIVDVIRQKIFKIKTTEITDTLAKSIKDKITQGYSQGKSPREIAKMLDELKSNAKSIARTEVNQSVQFAHYEMTDDIKDKIGIELEKGWLTARDTHVRESHRAMEAMGWIPFNQIFPNNCNHPSDPAGPAEEVINCRCDLKTRVKRR